MFPLIFQSVQKFGMIGQEEFSHLVAVSQITPGPIAVNAATYVGIQVDGVGGGLLATLGIIFPSFVLTSLVLCLLKKYRETPTVEHLLSGVRPATMGLMAAAIVFIGQGSLLVGSAIHPLAVVLCLATVFLVGKVKVHPLWVLGLMGLVGAVAL